MSGPIVAATACAIYNLGWGLFHLTFWRILRWRVELPRLSRTNAAVMQILNLRLTWVFFVFAYIYWVHPYELVGSPIGRAVAWGAWLFWVGRSVEQVIFMNMRRRVHQVLFVLFLAGVVLHATLLL